MSTNTNDKECICVDKCLIQRFVCKLEPLCVIHLFCRNPGFSLGETDGRTGSGELLMDIINKLVAASLVWGLLRCDSKVFAEKRKALWIIKEMLYVLTTDVGSKTNDYNVVCRQIVKLILECRYNVWRVSGNSEQTTAIIIVHRLSSRTNDKFMFATA